MQVTGIILSGGKSSRMGQNKALMNFKGTRLIDNAISIIKPYVNKLLLSTNIAFNLNIIEVADEYPNIGPIGGIYSCLKNSTTEKNLIIPCDVPNIPGHLYEQILKESNNFDAVIPKLANGKLEPLVAFYSSSILPIIERQIQLNDYKLVNLFSKLKVKYINVNDSSFFKNINTPEDF